MRIRPATFRRSHLMYVIGALALVFFALFVLAVTPVAGRGQLGVLQQSAFTVREYVLPHKNPDAFAHDPAVAPDGSVYFADQPGSYIGRLDPETGAVKEFPTPTPKSGPHGIIVAPDGSVWYTGNAVGLVGRLDPKTGTITEFKTPGAADPHTPLWMDGTLWFTAQRSNS
jgi:streptogramin lyase